MSDLTEPGPAASCRSWHCESQTDLAADALRLARGMSYKYALFDLPPGGGKSVLQRPQAEPDHQTTFCVFGEAVASLQGSYITAEDVGTTVADMRSLRDQTPYVLGRIDIQRSQIMATARWTKPVKWIVRRS
ncbi:MAG: Glu/Leu/Phe/Val dehydrogenase dimerization domain-containing protein [Janthinobacterium lividum]